MLLLALFVFSWGCNLVNLRLTARDLTKAIEELPKNQAYTYPNPKNRGRIHIVDVQHESLTIKRYDPSKGKTLARAKSESISAQMLWRVANAFRPNQPIMLDRVLGASYNTRSALEALLAHTPQFSICYPNRVEIIASSSEIKKGHKHIVWQPDNPHQPNQIGYFQTNITISEVPGDLAMYDALDMPENILLGELDIDVVRRHAQMQIALVLIGRQLGFRTWVARNDRAIVYNQRPLGEMQGVIARLEDERLVAAYPEAVNAALLIDCIWFRNARFMPAVIEIEHSTGVTSGLTRMRGLFDNLPPFPTRYVVVAADEDREKVVTEANRPQFQQMKTQFFPYSAVEELYALCQRRGLGPRGVNEEFLDYYMEQVVDLA